MKKLIIISIISFVILYGCQCKHCQDNLTIENNKIPYFHGEVIIFENDTLGKMYDTVFLELGKINTDASFGCMKSNDPIVYEYCSNWSNITYSNNFTFGIRQLSNKENYKIQYFTNRYYIKKNETIIYKQKATKTICFYSSVDTVGSEIWNYTVSKDSTFAYNNYYFITDTVIKLIQYTTVYKDGTRRIWRLKE